MTPMLVGTVQWAILNPFWNVPVDLAQTLIAPKILSGRTLKSMNMEARSDWTEAAQVLRGNTIDWHAIAAGTQELRLRQLPGAYNSMGKVKFLFPNDFGIFLHDTPERELLAKDDRHFSNGCIRLEDADRRAGCLVSRCALFTPAGADRAVAGRGSGLCDLLHGAGGRRWPDRDARRRLRSRQTQSRAEEAELRK